MYKADVKWRREARGGVWMVMEDEEGGRRTGKIKMRKVGDHLEGEGRRIEAVNKITIGLIGMIYCFDKNLYKIKKNIRKTFCLDCSYLITAKKKNLCFIFKGYRRPQQ